MTPDSARQTVRPFTTMAGIALVVIAALKLFGVRLGIPGSITEIALVGIGLLHI